MTTAERLIIDLYRFCDRLDIVFIDKTPDFDSFDDFLRAYGNHIACDTKNRISHDLRLLLSDYVKELQK